MTLEFLTAAVPEGGPPAESPMVAAAQRGGARIDVRDGWRVPVAFAGEAEERRAVEETVAFADVSSLTKTELQGVPEALASCAGGLAFGRATLYDGAWWCPLTPSRALVVGTPPQAPGLDGLHAVDVTTQLCGLRIQGPLTRQLMARFCALDLRPAVAPPTTLLPGSVARTPGFVIVEGPDQLLVLVGAALAEYLWTVVADAAQRLGGQPVGADVLGGGPRLLEEVTAGA